MFKLDNSFTQRPFTVIVVGCGGTGAFVTEGLCRFLPPEANLILVDHDRVEERNLIRQSPSQIPLSFFTSFFTPTADYGNRSKKHPDSLMALWRELNGKKRYPLSDLVLLGKIKDIME